MCDFEIAQKVLKKIEDRFEGFLRSEPPVDDHTIIHELNTITNPGPDWFEKHCRQGKPIGDLNELIFETLNPDLVKK